MLKKLFCLLFISLVAISMAMASVVPTIPRECEWRSSLYPMGNPENYSDYPGCDCCSGGWECATPEEAWNLYLNLFACPHAYVDIGKHWLYEVRNYGDSGIVCAFYCYDLPNR